MRPRTIPTGTQSLHDSSTRAKFSKSRTRHHNKFTDKNIAITLLLNTWKPMFGNNDDNVDYDEDNNDDDYHAMMMMMMMMTMMMMVMMVMTKKVMMMMTFVL